MQFIEQKIGTMYILLYLRREFEDSYQEENLKYSCETNEFDEPYNFLPSYNLIMGTDFLNQYLTEKHNNKGWQKSTFIYVFFRNIVILILLKNKILFTTILKLILIK